MRPPIFIVGNPRSGTTLLRLMINNHSNIMVPPECGFAVWWYEKYKDWCAGSNHEHHLLTCFLQDLSTSKKIETWNMDFRTLGEYVRLIQPSNYADLVSCVYIYFGNSVRREFHRWGDKNNFHIRWIELLHVIFPNASFLHIVRDGRDVASSYKNLANIKMTSKYAPSLPTYIVDIASEWTKNIEKAISSFEAIGWEKVYEVRYEDLVANSRIELMRICNFLDEPFDDRMLRYYMYNAKEHQEPIDFLQWKSKTLEKPTTSEIGKYKRDLTNEEVELFDRQAGYLLEMYRYECNS